MTIQCLDCSARAEGSDIFIESLREIHALAEPEHTVVVTADVVMACSR